MQPQLSHTIIPSPLGDLVAIADGAHLLMLDFADSPGLEKKISTHLKDVSRSGGKIDIEVKFQLPTLEKGISEDLILIQTKKELSEYFTGKRTVFTIPLAPSGTDFQHKTWRALTGIPYGETRSYGEEAILAGVPRAVRAIGGANNKNPIVIIIPCHRVIGKSGKMVGYGGGLDRKIWLLEHEKKYLKNNLEVL